MREQPVPTVDRADVERIVRRDFPADAFDEILGILDHYQSDHGLSAGARVHLAALKLAKGNREVHGPSQPRDVDEIIEGDWHQYQAWLNR